MARFGKRSQDRLNTCHQDLVLICNTVIPHYDFAVIWGFRGKEAQNEAVANGYSNAPWPTSSHNVQVVVDGNDMATPCSDAVDIVPYYANRPHIRWDQHEEFIHLAGYMQMAAGTLGINLTWGGDWDNDQDLHDFNRPFDLAHFERA